MGDPRDTKVDAETEREDALYAELNTYSKSIRKTATEFATLLEKTENKPKEIQMLILSLNKIATTDIESIDSALNNFKKCIASMALKNDSTSLFGKTIKQDELPALVEKYSFFVNETISLATKAIELNNKP